VPDIPVEDGPLVGKATQPPLFQEKKSFFNQSLRRRPDELLTDVRETAPPVPPPPISEPAPVPEPEIVREPAVQKLKREETAQAAAEVARDITSTLEQGIPAYQYPPVSLLKERADLAAGDALGELRVNQERLAETIRSFGIEPGSPALCAGHRSPVKRWSWSRACPEQADQPGR
jgi:S-DNA-T family DNA segregation ATPase FtsK/SpoIIIE